MKIAEPLKWQLQIFIAAITLSLFALSAYAETRPAHSRISSYAWGHRIRTMELRTGDNRLPATLTWDQAAQCPSSPESICKAVKQRIKYSRDIVKEDEWRSGRSTWERGKGDCEDFASTVQALCKAHGFEADIYVLRTRSDNEAHAVTMGKWNGRVWVSSNGSYADYQCARDAKEAVARDLGWWPAPVEMVEVSQLKNEKDSRYLRATAKM